jgi:hypothetical protein
VAACSRKGLVYRAVSGLVVNEDSAMVVDEGLLDAEGFFTG